MIFAAISSYFQLSTHSNRAVEFLAFLDALHDLFEVVLKVQRVVIDAAESYFDVKLLEFHQRLID